MSSNKKNIQSIFWYAFKTMLIVIVFNFIIMSIMSRLVFNNFYFSSQNELFSNIYNKIKELDEIDVASDKFREIIDMCQYSNCTIEVYDSSTNQRLYSPYVYINNTFAEVDSKPIFDEIIGEGSAIVLNGVDSDQTAQQAINALNGHDNAYSLLMRYSDNIYILIQTSTNMRNNYQRILSKTMLWCLGSSFILGIFLAYFLSRDILNNILSIKGVAQKITQHDFSERCRNSKFSEFFELGNYINQMSDSIKSQISEIEEKNEILEKDIENRKKVEQSQKEFISNVSHELKTPISIIYGYAEGIKYGIAESEESREKYCTTIIDECERMKNIVKQLLDLSALEHISLDIKENDISKMLFIIIERFATKIADRNFVLHCEDGLTALCDYDEIERVIINYIENAVKYSSDDITIRAYDEEEYVHIGVINKGEIEDDTKERMWERFYRADKSHKRNGNSTGLGLSIVKATMEKHDMPYGVISEHGETEFFIKIKKYDLHTVSSQKIQKTSLS